ncbi:MAG: MFS transporter [Verrucomicrobiota bacterium]
MSSDQTKMQSATFPPGIGNVFGFASFNALSFQMIMGSPMVLYAKSLGASATVLGMIAGMMPLMTIFQLPAARYVANVGYKRFVLGGWTTRVVFIFIMALVPVTDVFLSPETRLALMLFLLFWFNLSRGISSCGWLPWITSLIPAAIRGKYLAREAAVVNLSAFLAMILSAACVGLGKDPRAGQFTAVFVISALAGVVSLAYLRRIPEGESPEQVRTSTTPVPWREIANHPPFRKLLRMNVAWGIAYGGISAFSVAFLKVSVGLAEGSILLLTSMTFLGGLCSLWLMGTRLDRFGSKPVLVAGCLGWLVILTGWVLIAGKLVAPHLWLILLLMFLMGLGASMINMANTRLAMAIIPVMGRNHFFALFSVVGSLVLGLAPMGWGLLIDAFRVLETEWHGFDLNRYAVFFLAAGAAFVVLIFFCRKLEEPEAGSMEALLRDFLDQTPLRITLRFWPRG